jgi:hypothetical protein
MSHSVETRLLGLTPQQYRRLVDQARRDAPRLRREALHRLALAAAAWLRRRLDTPAGCRVEA